jgi:hypothetical protein
MIRFAGKQCGIIFERPREPAGTLIFCGCGTANRVPWESTLPETSPGAEAASEQSSVGKAVPVGEEREPPPRRLRPEFRFEREIPQRNPAFCFNHQDQPVHIACAACGQPFCARCVVSLRGEQVCGPCKNFRIRSSQRPSQFSVMALFSLLLGLFTAPAGLFCVSLSAMMQTAAPSVAALLMPLLALILGAKALRDIETRPRMSGRSIAIAGMVSGGVTAFLTVVWIVLLERQME